LRKFVIISLFLLSAATLFAGSKLPAYKGPVNDPAGVLGPGAVEKLDAKVLAYRKQTGSEIGVLIVSSLGNESIEDYAHDVFNAWGIGKKDKDNGVLFLVAIKQREARVEVGYGLEDKLTDLEAGRLVGRNSPMAKYFRQGDYAAGTGAVLDGIVQAIGGDYNPPKATDGDRGSGSPLAIPIIIIIFILISIIRRKSSSRRGFGGPFWGGFGGGFGGGSSSGGGGGFSFGGGSSGGGGASGGW
jgi:uncharacterized protein